MAGALLKQLNNLIANMLAAGYLDDQFRQLQMLKDESEPGFMGEVITNFCSDAERMIGDLTRLVNVPAVDFAKVEALLHQLKGSSGSIGASRVQDACLQFRVFCEKKCKDGCLRSLDALRNEFYDLRNKFQTMLQLEEQIRSFFPKH